MKSAYIKKPEMLKLLKVYLKDCKGARREDIANQKWRSVIGMEHRIELLETLVYDVQDMEAEIK